MGLIYSVKHEKTYIVALTRQSMETTTASMTDHNSQGRQTDRQIALKTFQVCRSAPLIMCPPSYPSLPHTPSPPPLIHIHTLVDRCLRLGCLYSSSHWVQKVSYVLMLLIEYVWKVMHLEYYYKLYKTVYLLGDVWHNIMSSNGHFTCIWPSAHTQHRVLTCSVFSSIYYVLLLIWTHYRAGELSTMLDQKFHKNASLKVSQSLTTPSLHPAFHLLPHGGGNTAMIWD